MPTAPTRLTPSSASAGTAPTRKAATSASAGSAPTRKAASSASAGSAPSRISGVGTVVVPGAGIEFEGASNTLTVGAGALSYGIRVGHFVSGTNIQAGTVVTAIDGQEVTIDLGTEDTSDATDITFSNVPPAPTRKSS